MTAPRTLRVGARGSDVTDLQTDLVFLGHYDRDRDGLFGPATDRAVRSFQRAAGLAPDGVVGSRTRAAIERAIDALPLDPDDGDFPAPSDPTVAPRSSPGVRDGGTTRVRRPRKRMVAALAALVVAAWPALDWLAEPAIVIVDAVIEALIERVPDAPATPDPVDPAILPGAPYPRIRP